MLDGDRHTDKFREQIFVDLDLVSKTRILNRDGTSKIHYKLFENMFVKMLTAELANYLTDLVRSRNYHSIHNSGKIVINEDITPNLMLNSYFLSLSLINLKLPDSEYTHKDLMRSFKTDTMILYFHTLLTAKKVFAPKYIPFIIETPFGKDRTPWKFTVRK